MHLVFFDESGFSPRWTLDIAEQPFYVLAAVCLQATAYADACEDLPREFAFLGVTLPHPLGKGAEIKARAVAGGEGWWRNHNDERNKFRELMLSFPTRQTGTAFVVIVDKRAHFQQYAWPENPVTLAMRFLFERLQWYLSNEQSNAYCVYDHDKRRTDATHLQSIQLIREGSDVIFFSDYYSQTIKTTNTLDRITELALGQSHSSIGLQVADFFATMAYCYYRDGQPADCGWWNTLNTSLFHESGQIVGRGLKVFP
ncbi:MAG TPA: DUF3800 domain-containing protein [Verrucomicrobiae bacterium]|jgi:hypothetical protein|nr:DUF3800 domain-containing protein [Verrucomicrobiae bacterium]